jgi:PIN domain nuclease of toxin-antitoxin system
MKLLIDTQTFIWFVEDDEKLSLKIKSIMEDTNNQLMLSIACLWEITIKMNLGKIVLSGNIAAIIDKASANGFEILPIESKHLITLSTLELFHRDPFDRIMIAQAITENISIITTDNMFDLYPIKRIGGISNG